MANLITADFVAVDSRVRTTSFTGQRRKELTYWEILAGHLSDRLEPDYSDFMADIKGGTAHVFAIGITQDVSSVWLYRDTSWVATGLFVGLHNPNWKSWLAERAKKRSR